MRDAATRFCASMGATQAPISPSISLPQHDVVR